MHIDTLLVVSIALAVLMALAWALAAWAIRSARPAILHWVAADGCLAASVYATNVRHELPGMTGFVASDLLSLVTCVALRRGLQILAHQEPTDPEHGAVLGLGGAILIAARLSGAEAAVAVALLSVTLGFVILRTAVEGQECMRAEFNYAVSVLTVLPLWAIGLHLVTRALAVTLDPRLVSAGVPIDSPSNQAFTLFMLLAFLAMNMTLGGIVTGRLVAQARRLSRPARADAGTVVPSALAIPPVPSSRAGQHPASPSAQPSPAPGPCRGDPSEGSVQGTRQ